MKEKDLTLSTPSKKPMYTNSKGDEFFEGDKLYWGDLLDWNVDNGRICSHFAEDDTYTEAFKTEEEAAKELIKKLGKKVKENTPCMYLKYNRFYRNIGEWTPWRMALNIGNELFYYLTFSDFEKLVENEIIK